MSRRSDSILDWLPVLVTVLILLAFFFSLIQFLGAHEAEDTNDLIFWGVSMLLLATGGNAASRSGS
jgi:hypothetical protein